MGQFSMEKSVSPGSVLRGNQHTRVQRETDGGAEDGDDDEGEEEETHPGHQRGSMVWPPLVEGAVESKKLSRRAWARSRLACSDWYQVPIIVICWETRPRSFCICATCWAAMS